jgi:hypothetical protein
MKNNIIDSVKGQLIARIKSSGVTRVTKSLLQDLLDDFKLMTDNFRSLSKVEKDDLLVELSTYYTADLNYSTDLILLERGMVIHDVHPKMHKEWIPETQNRFYWRKQREFLIEILAKRDSPEMASKIINSIDFETEEILKNMENPTRSKFDSRGLVVGYVQSGKTANFTALISKAADAGYRFIIVLAGIHDELRQQTQIRIDKELTGYNNLQLEGDFVEWNAFEVPKRWYNLTSAGWLSGKETGEFSGKGINNFGDTFLNTQRPVIAIMKKNVKVMDRLVKWINQSNESDRINVPLLIIDDEADQASIDGNATKNDSDPAKTNEKIRTIINLFKRTGYVGYTATPFANVFIKHDSNHQNLGDDLYPNNFIYSLPEPPGYFGTRKIFTEDLDQYFVIPIRDSQHEKKTLSDRGELTENLIKAIYTFIIAISIRKLRGYENAPMSMMINVNHLVTKMDRIGKIVSDFVLKSLPKHYDQQLITQILDEYLESTKILNEKLDVKNNIFRKNIILKEVVNTIKSKNIKVRTLNSGKDDKLDYAVDPSMKVIAIGGNKLSRGLTLEGLTITYYLRESSRQYDTLLQMGRWFGYRKGYEDLVRIYTSGLLWNHYKELAKIELEFRANVKQMIDEDKTPNEFSIGVRQILGLLPVARNRMGAAVLQSVYGGSQVSVTRLTLEKPNLIDDNVFYTKELLNKIESLGIKYKNINDFDYPTRLASEVPNSEIVEFLEKFHLAKNVDDTYLEFKKDNLLKYVNSIISNGIIKSWNVGIVSVGPNNDNKIMQLSKKVKVRCINRSRLIGAAVNGAYNIKAVSSKADRLMDLDKGAKNEYDNRKVPLLLIYCISKNSKPNTVDSKSREELYKNVPKSAHRNPIAYSVIFPPDSESKSVYKQKNLNT